jgi:hypothetical protein
MQYSEDFIMKTELEDCFLPVFLYQSPYNLIACPHREIQYLPRFLWDLMKRPKALSFFRFST